MTRRRFVSAPEAARYLECDVRTVRHLFDQGELKGYRTPGGFYRIKLEGLLEDAGHVIGSKKSTLPPESARARLRRL